MKLVKIVIEVYLKENETIEQLFEDLNIDAINQKDIDSLRVYDIDDNQIAWDSLGRNTLLTSGSNFGPTT